jgi:hypothetical protein
MTGGAGPISYVATAGADAVRQRQVTPEALDNVLISSRHCLDFVHGLRPTVEINPQRKRSRRRVIYRGERF